MKSAGFDISAAASALRARRVSSLELTEEALACVARLDPTLRAFITVLEESARASARRADEELARGVDRGPLHGVPYAAKDLFETRGVRTTAGSKIFADYVPDRDADAVERLAAAGAVLIGKTNMHELAYGMTSVNPHYGAVRNPWDHERVAGGSSGGSAVAVVTGMSFLGLGTDTGGSIRVPASFCGCVGLKPTYDRVSRRGVLPLSESQDHVGPLTRTVRDAALALNVLAGSGEFTPPAQPDLHGVRLGVIESRVDEDVRAAILRAAGLARDLGAQVDAATIQPEQMNAVGTAIILAEAAAALAPHLDRHADFGDDVRALLEQGRVLPAIEYIQAQRERRRLCEEFAAVWETHDYLVLPSTPLTAPLVPEAAGARAACAPFTRPFNLLGVPAISIPCGFDRRGLPIGVQLVAAAFHERALLAVAAALEDALDVRPSRLGVDR